MTFLLRECITSLDYAKVTAWQEAKDFLQECKHATRHFAMALQVAVVIRDAWNMHYVRMLENLTLGLLKPFCHNDHRILPYSINLILSTY